MRGYHEICWNGITCIAASPLSAGVSGGLAAPKPLSDSANFSNVSDSSGSASGAALIFITVAVVAVVEAGGEAAAAESVVAVAVLKAAVMVPLLLSPAVVVVSLVSLDPIMRALRPEPEAVRMEEEEAAKRLAVTEPELPRTVSCVQEWGSEHQSGGLLISVSLQRTKGVYWCP